MKGTVDLTMTMFSVLLTMVGFMLIWVAMIGNITNISADLVKPSFEKLAIVDATHNVAGCLSENGLIVWENVKTKLGQCITQTGVEFIEVFDMEEGKRESEGSAAEKASTHTIYKNTKAGNEIHQARIKVKKSIIIQTGKKA